MDGRVLGWGRIPHTFNSRRKILDFADWRGHGTWASSEASEDVEVMRHMHRPPLDELHAAPLGHQDADIGAHGQAVVDDGRHERDRVHQLACIVWVRNHEAAELA
eukprot:272538-Chlamydomonas_euryale.AAC.3